MSLILEALRKSEAERRRGLAPDLLVELPPVVRPRNPTLSPALWLLVAAAVLAAGAWLARGSWSPPTRDVTPAVIVPEDASRPLPPARSTGPAAAGDAFPRADAQAAPLPATDATPATVAAAPAMLPGAQPGPTTATPAVQELPAVPPPPASVREPQPSQVHPEPVPVPQPESPPTAVSQGPGNAALLQLADLPAEQRKQLPPLRISMHMWDQDPARRFVIIDGARLREGDRVGDAVVEQITADSVLLDWNGRRLHLPLLR